MRASRNRALWFCESRHRVTFTELSRSCAIECDESDLLVDVEERAEVDSGLRPRPLQGECRRFDPSVPTNLNQHDARRPRSGLFTHASASVG